MIPQKRKSCCIITSKILKKINFIRFKKGYSQYNMAYELEISQNAYHKIEKGYTKLTIPTFLKICKILDESPESFFS